MVKEALKKNGDWVVQGRAAFIHSDILSLPYEKETFNKIFTVNTIYFWEQPAQVLSEIKRLLQPNGLLIIALRPKRLMEHYPFTRYGFNMYSKLEVTELLAGNGFHVSNVFENQEPDFELNGEKFEMQNLVAVAYKN
jgi:ubiquinone/menaquinone biosynthesis C-methylase UbiE